MKRLMITFPFPNIYLSFGHICCCCCCCFFFFLSVPYVKQITNDAVYMIQFYIKKYLKGAISVEMLQRTMNHGRLRSCDEILCPNYTFTCFQITHKKLHWPKSKLETSVGLEILENKRSSAICRV